MIYLDNAATTRLLPEVRAAMAPFLDGEYGNASSLHSAGRRARRALEDARETVARALGADPKEVVFTSGATESNHLALLGAAGALRAKGNHLITTAIEHPSVLEPCSRLERDGWRVSRVPVDDQGILDPARFAAAVTSRTVLASVMAVNNEVGTIQPLAEIRRRIPGVILHVDAAQAVGKIPVDLADADLMTFSAHKIHGPKGTGALWIRKGTAVESQLLGGGQEFERRAGTENVAGAAGFAAAMAGLARLRPPEALRERLRAGLESLGGVRTHGHPDRRVSHMLNVSIEGVEGEAAILALDAEGVCVSSGSACASMSLEPSYVLRAMGLPPAIVRSSVRFSLSALTTEAEIDGAVAATRRVVERLRRIAPVAR